MTQMLNGNPDARRHARMKFAQFFDVPHQRTTAREDDTANEFALETRTPNFPNNVIENFLHARLYNTSKIFFANFFKITSFNARNRDDAVVKNLFREGVTKLDFQSLGLVLHHSTTFFNVRSNHVAAKRNDCRVANNAFLENRDVGRAATDVHQSNARFFFFFAQNRNCRSDGFEGHTFNFQTTSFNATVNVI